jgi:aerobic-type carbon monoxide dehydrogenase small subunit (CoxS/CutS family)
MAISFKVNGRPVSVDAPEDTPLLWVIREGLKLTGTITSSPSGEINAKFVRFALASNPRLGPRPGHCDVKRPV